MYLKFEKKDSLSDLSEFLSDKPSSEAELFKNKIIEEFNCELPTPLEEVDYKNLYEKMTKEKNIFVAFMKGTGGYLYGFTKSQRRWLTCIFYEDSFEKVMEYEKTKRFRVEDEEAGRKAAQDFHYFLNKNSKIEEAECEKLFEFLKLLCKINAHTTLKVLFKTYSLSTINLSKLLFTAIRFVGVETVKLLIEAGADINEFDFCGKESSLDFYGNAIMCLTFQGEESPKSISIKITDKKVNQIMDILLSNNIDLENACYVKNDYGDEPQFISIRAIYKDFLKESAGGLAADEIALYQKVINYPTTLKNLCKTHVIRNYRFFESNLYKIPTALQDSFSGYKTILDAYDATSERTEDPEFDSEEQLSEETPRF